MRVGGYALPQPDYRRVDAAVGEHDVEVVPEAPGALRRLPDVLVVAAIPLVEGAC